MGVAVDRPEVMHGDDAGHEKKANEDALGTRGRTEVRDFQRKPDGEEFIRCHNHQNPDVGVADDVDEKVEDLTRTRTGRGERGKVEEILGDQD